MKSIKVYLSVLVFGTNMASASANMTWVQTPFWTAPQVTEVQPQLRSLSKSLEKNCQVYKKNILNEDGSLRSTVSSAYVDRVRKAEVQDYTVDFFEARFALSDYDSELDLSKEMTIDESKEKLPFYSQIKSTTLTNPEDSKEIKIVAEAGSFTEISRGLGLGDSEVTIQKINYAPVLIIKGRDVACDLASGKVRIEAKTTSLVTLTDEGFSNLTNFYTNKIQRELNDILIKHGKDSNFIKAARLGYRLGDHITDRNNNHPELVEKQIEEMMKLFFVPNTLNNSSYLVDMDGGKSKIINLMSSVDGAPVTLKFELKK